MYSNVIDSHVHIWTSPTLRYPHSLTDDPLKTLPYTFTLSAFESAISPFVIDRVVLVQMSVYGNDNSYMLDAIQHAPSRFCGVGVVDLGSSSLHQDIAHLASRGVRGLRIAQGQLGNNWLNSPSMRHLWALAQSQDLAICPLVNPNGLSALDRMCADFPETAVVIDHMGRLGMDGVLRRSEIQSLCTLSRHPRVYVKISAFYALGLKREPHDELVPAIRALYESFGPTRLMWGSDSPFQVQTPFTYNASLNLVQRLDFMSEEDRNWILGNTASIVFFRNIPAS